MTCHAIYWQKARTKSKDIGGSDQLTAVCVCQRVKVKVSTTHSKTWHKIKWWDSCSSCLSPRGKPLYPPTMKLDVSHNQTPIITQCLLGTWMPQDLIQDTNCTWDNIKRNNTVHSPPSISHKNWLMCTFIINTNLLTLCHFNIFQPSKGHLQGVQLIYFNSKINKMSYQM
jgi:hypothetical protein